MLYFGYLYNNNYIYILEKLKFPKKEIKYTIIPAILEFTTILCAKNSTIQKAMLNENFKDLEDSVQNQIATENKCNIILTNNLEDFKNSTIPALTPLDFIKLISHND